MGSQTNTITINGKLYDINSGEQIKQSSSTTAVPVSSSTKNVDGIKPNIKPIDNGDKLTPKQPVNQVEVPHKKIINSFQASAKSANRKLSKTNTLARNFVKKPNKPSIETIKEELLPKKIELHKSINAQRLLRAKDVQQNNKVSKFGDSTVPIISKTSANIDVVPEPSASNSKYDISDTPPASIPVQPTQSTQKGATLFENALQTSTSHKEEFNNTQKSNKKKITTIASSIIIAVFVSGFLIYQNIPNIALKTASSKIGFSATIPSYKPSGFSLEESVKYQTGSVILNFRSNSDDRNYVIEQTKSEFDSASLLNNYLVSDNKEYQTQISNGRTVYIYDGTSATWVDGGIWYKLTDNAHLSNEQLLKIVSSI